MIGDLFKVDGKYGYLEPLVRGALTISDQNSNEDVYSVRLSGTGKHESASVFRYIYVWDRVLQIPSISNSIIRLSLWGPLKSNCYFSVH